MVLGSTQPLVKMNTRNIPGGSHLYVPKRLCSENRETPVYIHVLLVAYSANEWRLTRSTTKYLHIVCFYSTTDSYCNCTASKHKCIVKKLITKIQLIKAIMSYKELYNFLIWIFHFMVVWSISYSKPRDALGSVSRHTCVLLHQFTANDLDQ
jgi:hypothetical protein